MFYILSYIPGLSGDFIASLVHQNNNFYSIYQNTDQNNRYWFPDLTENVLGYHFKLSKFTKLLSSNDIDKLNIYYKNKSLVLPTHNYTSAINFNKVKYIRLFTLDEMTIKTCYILWWIKSHLVTQEPIAERLDYIKKIKDEKIKKELLENYKQWKYVAFNDNLLYNNRFNLQYYVYKKFYQLKKLIKSLKYENYINIDIKNALYDCNKNVLEDVFCVDLKREDIENYIQSNLKLVENFDLKNNIYWLDSLYNFILKNIGNAIKL